MWIVTRLLTQSFFFFLSGVRTATALLHYCLLYYYSIHVQIRESTINNNKIACSCACISINKLILYVHLPSIPCVISFIVSIRASASSLCHAYMQAKFHYALFEVITILRIAVHECTKYKLIVTWLLRETLPNYFF